MCNINDELEEKDSQRKLKVRPKKERKREYANNEIQYYVM